MNLSQHFEPTALMWATHAVKQAQDRFPRICPNGLDWYTPGKPEAWDDADYAMVSLCRWYLNLAEPIKTPTTSSYSLKHRIEEHFTVYGQRSYVHNGSCIVAAMALGFPIKTSHFNRLTCSIGISRHSITKLQGYREEVTEHVLHR